MEPKWRRIFLPRHVELLASDGSVPLVIWTGGHAHLLCRWPVISVQAATPGRWWRWAGRLALERLVEVAGGAAWDERGVLGYAPPTEEAWRAAWVLLAHVRWEETGEKTPPDILGFLALGQVKPAAPAEDEMLEHLVRAADAKKAFDGLETWGYWDGWQTLLVSRRNPMKNDYDLLREPVKVPQGWQVVSASFPVEGKSAAQEAAASSEDKTSEEEEAA